jgi:tripartite-type tricarboxylate transporter receptor subunit TctC
MTFNMRIACRNALAATAASLVLLAGPPARVADANFPTRPIRMVVGFAAKSGIDYFCRTVANKLQEVFRQGVVVDN